MFYSNFRFAISLFSALVLLLIPVASEGAAELVLSARPDKVYPGQALLVRVAAGQPMEKVTGEFEGQSIRFFPEPGGDAWSGLIGLDLDLAPGDHLLTYGIGFRDGSRAEGNYPITVEAKTFPEERINVARKYVDLSKEDLKRVRREKRMLRGIYTTQSDHDAWQSGFAVPADGEMGSPFGLRRYFNGQPRSPHSGADLRAGPGAPVVASNDGRVVFAGGLFFSGNTVILDHGGGLYTLYAHLSDFTVATGEEARKNQLIGHVGATGRVTGPHLHWSAKLNGARIDPFSLVNLVMPVQSNRKTTTTITERPGDPTDRGSGHHPKVGSDSGQGDESQ